MTFSDSPLPSPTTKPLFRWKKGCMLLAITLMPLLAMAQPERIYTSLSQVDDPSAVYILHLRGQRLREVPPQVFTFANLIELDLSRNRLDTLPPAIARLPHLQRLNLHRNRLPSLPDSIGFLPQLKALNASRNPLLELPSTMARLSQLDTLTLYLTGVVALPPECAALNYSLRLLDLRACPLTYAHQAALDSLLPTPRKRWDYVCNCK
ncbi:MAG: leucine-rich repeat domain-containing protein [Bacteroidales bacterium]|nr:leucine-rich repeat domain-containing protein [Bacteroidales bacterium]